MIKFFRKIRQNLLLEGKTGKYFKYAIGEILLVIIGILIAVSINSWNEGRKLLIQEQIILEDLKQEMKVNLEALEIAIEGNENSYQAAIKMIDLFKNTEAFNAMSKSEFSKLVVQLNYNRTYDPSNGILNSIISSGQINQISDKELKYLLASLKEITVDALENVYKIENQRDEPMKSAFTSGGFMENDGIQIAHKQAMFENPDFRWATIVLFYYSRKNGLEEEIALKLTLNRIIELLDKNIKK